MHALPGAPGGGGNEKAPQKRGREGLPCTVPALMGQPSSGRAPDSQDRAPCRSPRHAAPSTLGVAVMGRPGVYSPNGAPVGLYSSCLSEAPVLWGSLPTASGSCSPFGLMANATGEMPFSVFQLRDSSRRSARPITPLRDDPGWIGEPTKKPAGREPCGLVICRGVFPHRFHVLPDSPPGDVYRDERGRDCWRLRSRHAVYLSLCRPQPSSAPSCA